MADAAPPILTVEDVSKAFGGLHALDGCSLDVRERSITGLIGPNGAGKTTLFNTIVGLYTPDAGKILFRGQRIDGEPSYEVVRRGLLKTFQIPREMRNLTVLENTMLWARANPGESLLNLSIRPGRTAQAQWEVQKKAEGILRFAGLFDLRDEYAKNLSGGQKKILELARALMADPTLILLDEPVAGVNPVFTMKILDLIERLRTEGKTFFLIEHDMDVMMKRCDWIIVLHQGRKIAEGRPESVKANPEVVEAYLGA